jgi:hypothetical protein
MVDDAQAIVVPDGPENLRHGSTDVSGALGAAL